MQIARIFPSGLADVSSVRSLVRPAVRAARAAPVWGRVGLARRGRGPLAVFLPAYGRHGAARLRIYNVAGALRPLGWRTLVMPWTLTLAQRHRVLARARPDVVVMQGARHALNRPGFYPGYPIVYDIDDADFHLPHLTGPVRRAMGDVDAVIAGSAYIADWCRAAGAGEVQVIWTGTPVSQRPRPHQATRPPVVAWAQTRPMTYVREANLVRDVMARVAVECPGVTLRLYDRHPDDDRDFAAGFASTGLRVEWCKTLRYRDFLQSLDDVRVGLAPLCPETPFSRGKSFGKVLAYLDRGVPVVASDACEHGAFFTRATGVVSNDPEVWSRAIVRMIGDGALRRRMADAAFNDFRARLTDEVSARQADRLLRAIVSDGSGRYLA